MCRHGVTAAQWKSSLVRGKTTGTGSNPVAGSTGGFRHDRRVLSYETSQGRQSDGLCGDKFEIDRGLASTNKKGVFKMSDVERICMMNHERRKLEEACNAHWQARENRKNAEKARKLRLRSATLLCAVFVGVGLTLAWLGVEAMQLRFILAGAGCAISACLIGGILDDLSGE